MSFELIVVTQQEPADLPASSEQVEIDEPLRVETEDLPDAVVVAMLDPAWQVELHARPSQRAQAEARRLARRIAEGADGVVYDPQDDVVLWPRRGRREAPKLAGERRITVVDLTWCFAGPIGRDDGERFLRVVRRVLPEAEPRRWGTYEPMQGRGVEGFAEAWAEVYDRPFWTGRHPVFWGGISTHRYMDGWKERPQRVTDRVGVTLDAEATVLTSNPWRRAMERALATIADEMGAFFAAAHLERDWIVNRGHLSADHLTQSRAVVAKTWLGLPNFACWLMWFGPEYAGLVAGSPTSELYRAFGSGALLRASEAPDNAVPPHDLGIDPRLIRPGGALDAEEAKLIPPLAWRER